VFCADNERPSAAELNGWDDLQASGVFIVSDIFNYADPTALYQHIELNFDATTKRMVGLFMYPARMTWDDCKKAWGDNVTTTKNPDGTQFHNYKNRRLNVFLDKRSNVISIGVY